MNNSLTQWTKLVLIVSTVVQVVFGAGALVSQAFWNGLFMPAPLPPSQPVLLLQYFGWLFLTNAAGAAFSLRENDWSAARVYLFIAGLFVAGSVVLTLIAAFTPPGIPFILWGYVVLAALYLPSIVYAWRQQSARGS